MDNVIWLMWIVLGVMLIIAEVFTTGFVFLWFGIGALVAALVGLLGAGYLLQFFTFFLVSLILTALSKTIFNKYFTAKGAAELKTGVDSLPGKIGLVVAPSQGALGEGAVKVFGSTWTAYPAEGEAPFQLAEQVVVESVRGASIYVRRVGQLSDWRTSAMTIVDKDDD
jgi:membrane protein implicated in regulation of membrane protease activity